MKKIYTLFKQSLRAILANKARSFLTMLGIIIGIGSVIALMSLGEGANRSISDKINTLGATTLTISPGAATNERGGRNQQFGSAVSTLTTQDVTRLKDQGAHPSFNLVSGVITATSVVKKGSTELQTSINGVSPEYFNIQNLQTSSGRTFDSTTMGADVAIIGSAIASSTFQTANPIGQNIIINNKEFKVIGVLNAAAEGSLNNPNNRIFIPLSAASAAFHASNVSSIVVRANDKDSVEAARTDITNTLLQSHSINDPKLADFRVISPQDLLATVTQITGLLTSLLAGIASISLVVGGIGIMNIMLVAVTERTREIGLRKAVGAKTSDIMTQFLIETLLLTLLGGILGIALGWGIGAIFSKFVDLTPVITSKALFLAVGVSSAIGLIFGLYPALKASRLNPIDALRYE
jgi:putative ABC transport system permease protein